MNNLLKSILIGTATTAVGVGAGFVGGSTYKANNYDITSNSEYQQVVDKNTQLNAELENNKLALSSALTEKEQLNTELQTLQSQIVNLNQTINDKSEQIKLLELDIENKQTQLDQLNQDIADKLNQIAELQENAEANAEQILSLQNDIQQLNENIQNLQDDATDKDAQIEALNQQISEKLSQIEELQQNEKENALQIATLNEEINGLTANVTQLQNEIENKSIEIESLQNNILNYQTQVEELQNTINDKEQQIELLNIQISALQSKILISVNDETVLDKIKHNSYVSLHEINDENFVIVNTTSPGFIYLYNTKQNKIILLNENFYNTYFDIVYSTDDYVIYVTNGNTYSHKICKLDLSTFEINTICNSQTNRTFIKNYTNLDNNKILLFGSIKTYKYPMVIDIQNFSVQELDSLEIDLNSDLSELELTYHIGQDYFFIHTLYGSNTKTIYKYNENSNTFTEYDKFDSTSYEVIDDENLIYRTAEGEIYKYNIIDKSTTLIYTLESIYAPSFNIEKVTNTKYLIDDFKLFDIETGIMSDFSSGFPTGILSNSGAPKFYHFNGTTFLTTTHVNYIDFEKLYVYNETENKFNEIIIKSSNMRYQKIKLIAQLDDNNIIIISDFAGSTTSKYTSQKIHIYNIESNILTDYSYINDNFYVMNDSAYSTRYIFNVKEKILRIINIDTNFQTENVFKYIDYQYVDGVFKLVDIGIK